MCLTHILSAGSESPPLDYEPVFPPSPYPVPNIVHQTYDYQSPSFFLYLSLKCVQRFLRPEKHILWVNDEGRFRKGHWEGWRQQAAQQTAQQTWMHDLLQLIDSRRIDVRFLAFPAHPKGNSTAFAHEKAHRSDFVRMQVLEQMGGIYLDTDVFVLNSMDSLRVHNFTLSFDNIVNPDKNAPKRINNGVLLSAPNAPFLRLWQREYAAHFNPHSFDYDSSVVPYRLTTDYPDLVHVEMSRIAPLSYAFQTARIADAITCGILLPPGSPHGPAQGAIWAPVWGSYGRGYTFKDTEPDAYMYAAMSQRLALHLTMTQVRSVCSNESQLAHTFRTCTPINCWWRKPFFYLYSNSLLLFWLWLRAQGHLHAAEGAGRPEGSRSHAFASGPDLPHRAARKGRLRLQPRRRGERGAEERGVQGLPRSLRHVSDA